MFCPHCGSKLRDEARFCAVCGLPVQDGPAASKSHANKSAPTATGGNPRVERFSAQAETGSFAEQVKSTRKNSRRKIPMVFIVILVTLALAAAAFAATYIYQRNFSPEAKEQQVTVEQEGPQEQKEPEHQEQEEQDRLEASKALYNGVLSGYKAAADSGWQSQSDGNNVWANDVNTLSLYEQQGIMPGWFDNLSGLTLSYAYTDLGNDGVSDLVVALIAKDSASPSDYTPVGIFTSDGANVFSAIKGLIGARDWWSLLPDGKVFNHGTGGAGVNVARVYTVSNGQLVVEDEYSANRDRSPQYMHNGQGVTEAEYEEFTALDRTQPVLEWHMVSEFTPIETDQPDQTSPGTGA